MNYKKIYDDLCHSRKRMNRCRKDGLYEEHHIIPSMIDEYNTTSNTKIIYKKYGKGGGLNKK